MREQEMRLRVFRFLKARMRNMIMPAAVGIGLAGAGCLAKSGAVYSAPVPSDAAMVKSDTNRDVSSDDVSFLGPEVSPSDACETPMASDVFLTGQDVAAPIDQAVADQAPDRDSDDSGLADAASDTFAPTDARLPADLGYPETGMKYMGPMPLDTGASDTGGEAGPIIAKYVAPMPDAAKDLGLTVRYMAQMPDSGA